MFEYNVTLVSAKSIEIENEVYKIATLEDFMKVKKNNSKNRVMIGNASTSFIVRFAYHYAYISLASVTCCAD